MIELRNLGELKVGATPGRGEGESGQADYLRAGDVLDDGQLRPASEAAEPSRGRDTLLLEGDILVRARGVPAAAVVGALYKPTFPTNDLILFRLRSWEADPGFIATWLNLPNVRALLGAGSQGAALSRLSVQTLGSLQVPLPPLEEQRKIAALAECMEAEQRLLDRLRELRRQLNQQILQRLLRNTHDEGGNPRRGSHQAGRPEGPPVSPHRE